MKTFTLKLIAPSGVKYESEASAVFLPTPDGTIEILPDHMPLIALLSPGEIIIKNNSTEKSLVTDGGIVEITNNLVKILADEAEEAANLDELKILEAKHAAEERLANAQDDVARADATAQLEKQLSKLKYVKRRHLK
jgi:F-type H+-transporting ATPase subunit epsilon